MNFRAVEDHQEGSHTLCQKTLNFSKLLKDKEQEERVIDTVKTGCYHPWLWLLLAQLYIHQTVDEDGLHTNIVAVVIIVVAVVSPNGDPKKKQVYQPLFIGSIWSQRDSPHHLHLCSLTKTNFPVNTNYLHGQIRCWWWSKLGLLHVPNMNMPDEEQNKGGKMNEVLVFWVLNLMMQLDQY